MGKGAYVSISNLSNTDVTVSYSDFKCVYQNGDEGSNFGPISGTLHPGNSFGSQYIEAKATFPSCSSTTSTFTMTLSGSFGSLAFNFSESSSAWRVNQNKVSGGGIQATAIVVAGDRYTINVGIQLDVAWQPNSWMGDLTSIIGSRAINQIAIPGSHDSATYDIGITSAIAPAQDIPAWLNYVLYIPGLAPLVAQKVIAGWAEAQHLTCLEQLMSGIRYLDLRVVRSGSDYYICHGKYSCNFNEVVTDVQKFINDNPKEVVIMDLNHLYELNSDDDHKGLITKMFNAFGNKMAPNTLTANSHVSEFQQGGYQVIVLYDNEGVVNNPNLNEGGRLWSQKQISSPWPNKDNINDLQSAMKSNLDSRSTTQLFVLQGIVTPDGSVIAKGLVPFTSDPGSLQSMAKQVTPAVCNWSSQWKPKSIVIVDWFDCVGTTYVNTVINLNL